MRTLFMDSYKNKEKYIIQGFFRTIFLLFLLLGGLGCESDKKEEPENPVIENTEIYYFAGNEKQIISQNDTLSLNLGSTLTIYIDSVDNSNMYTQSPIKITENNNYSYDCYAQQSALAGVMLLWNNDSEWMMFYINVLPSLVQYYVLETNCTIDVANEALKEMIQIDLENNYIPLYEIIKLTYTTSNSGNIEIEYKSTEETIKGLFSEDDSGINMIYNGEEHYFSINYVGIIGIEEYSMTQDLTETFQTKYPTETINRILTSTTVLKYEY